MENIISQYGTEQIQVSDKKGSLKIAIQALFKNKIDKERFDQDFDEAVKEFNRLLNDGYKSLDAKYIQNSILKNKELIDKIRTGDERLLDKEKKELQNELLKNQIYEMRLKNIAALVELFTSIEKLGDIKIRDQFTGEIAKISRNLKVEIKRKAEKPSGDEGEL